MTNKLKTALYMRVSTSDQSADLQSDSLRAYAERAGLKVVGEYLDQGVSGKKISREQLDKLMQAARAHEIQCILVWKFDRFARSTKHLLTALEEFNYLNIKFVSVQDQIDTTSPMGKAMFTLIGAMAELESSLIGERVAAGMQSAKTRGKTLGRPPTAKTVVQEIERLAKNTELSVRQIHKEINQKASRGVVGEIIKISRSTNNQHIDTT